jgi:TonB family protein
MKIAPAFGWCVCALALVVSVRDARADDLATARELYASAAYEEALTALNRARTSGVSAADALAVEETRAFCLLALGRSLEAQNAIEALVTADPLYRPAADLSPRVRTAFSDVRRRMLPTIIPQQYAKAKAAYDRKDWTAAAETFAQVLSAIADPDIAHLASQPPLSDIRTLAAGFQELAVKSMPPPPLPVTPTASPTTVVGQTSGGGAPAAASAPARVARVYTALDAKVVAPGVIRQDLPPFNGRLQGVTSGSLEIVVNELGLVESAKVLDSVSPQYDRIAIDATRNWRYRPAMLDGMVVKFRKIIQIAVKPTS